MKGKNMDDGADVLDRFSAQIKWVTESVLASFELPSHMLDDLKQDAAMLVLSYAGVIDGRQHGKLTYIENQANGSETRIHSLLAVTLRTDLSQQVSRAMSKIPPASDTTIDDLLQSGDEPECESYEREYFEMLDESRMREKYPEFAMATFDGMSQDAIADALGVTDRTVRNRITAQKRSFIGSKLRSKGLVVEGDETLEELEEALQHLNAIA